MSYMFRKQSKKSPKPPRKHVPLGVPTNIAAGTLGFRAELATDPIGNQNLPHHDPEPDRSDSTVALDENNPRPSRVAFHHERREDQGLHAPETSTAGEVIDRGTEHKNDPTSECFLSLLPRSMFIQPPVLFHIRREHRLHQRGKRRTRRGDRGYVSIPLCHPLSVDVYQIRRETGKTRRLGLLPFLSMSRTDSVLSKPR